MSSEMDSAIDVKKLLKPFAISFSSVSFIPLTKIEEIGLLQLLSRLVACLKISHVAFKLF